MTGAVIAITIVLILVGGVTVSVVAYFRLQRHRADALAMASYRKLAEDSVARQELLEGQLVDLREQVRAIDKLLRSVD